MFGVKLLVEDESTFWILLTSGVASLWGGCVFVWIPDATGDDEFAYDFWFWIQLSTSKVGSGSDKKPYSHLPYFVFDDLSVYLPNPLGWSFTHEPTYSPLSYRPTPKQLCLKPEAHWLKFVCAYAAHHPSDATRHAGIRAELPRELQWSEPRGDFFSDVALDALAPTRRG